MSRMTAADWCCTCKNVPCDGLDCGPYLIGQKPRKQPAPKSAAELTAIRKRAWETRRTARKGASQ